MLCSNVFRRAAKDLANSPRKYRNYSCTAVFYTLDKLTAGGVELGEYYSECYSEIMGPYKDSRSDQPWGMCFDLTDIDGEALQLPRSLALLFMAEIIADLELGR